MYIVSTDVGGTCTDTVIFAQDEPIHIGKALSTPPNFGQGVIDSINNAVAAMDTTIEALFADTSLFMHGTTVVDNTILTRGGAETGLITTKGFEDILLVTRGGYGRWGGLPEDQIKNPVNTDRGNPLVPYDRIRGVAERVDYKGEALVDLDEAEAEAAIRDLVERVGVDALAVSFLWSFNNPAHERRIREIVERVAPDVYVTLSSDIAPVLGEYERTSTSVINAYVGRITSSYLAGLQTLLNDVGYAGPMMVMQGYGGLLPASEAGDRAVGMIECGPAAGVIGSKFLGDVMDDRDVIAADMGGTTFKVGVIQNGQIEYAREPMVDRYHYIAPKIDVVSIGSGGGSIVWLEEGTNIPKVGPRSAGADPGPVCYGRGGTEPTLTDIMTLIGYMDPSTFLGGAMTLDVDAARNVFTEQIAKPLGLDVVDAAIGIYRIAAAQISDLIHEVTVERGLDPRDFTLHAFGGSGPMLAGVFGRELNVKRILVPYTASVNCAFGLVSADIVHEYRTTTTLPVPSAPEDINAIFQPMLERGIAQLKEEGFEGDRVQTEWAVDLRYSRQTHELTAPLRNGEPLTEQSIEQLIDDFEMLYERRYGEGSGYREAGMEMTMFRLTARGLLDRPTMDKARLGKSDASAAEIGTRDIFVEAEGALRPGKIYDFERIEPGNEITGPAVIHTPITTIVLQDAQTGRMDEYKNIVIEFTD